MQGYIYRGRKPVHWSPSSRTALAEAELEVRLNSELDAWMLLHSDFSFLCWIELKYRTLQSANYSEITPQVFLKFILTLLHIF